MRTCLTALLLAGFGTMQMLAATPSVSAAELALKPVKKASVHVIHRKKRIVRSRIVRDLDGTIIALRRRSVVLPDYDGIPRVTVQTEAIPVRAAVLPRYYLNGEPVFPHVPRGWPYRFRRT